MKNFSTLNLLRVAFTSPPLCRTFNKRTNNFKIKVRKDTRNNLHATDFELQNFKYISACTRFGDLNM